MAQAFYRVRQFWQGFWARVTPAERQQVARILPAAALPLFDQMPVDAQRHSLNVLAGVQAAGYDQPDLAVAALLHDCGKVAAAQGGIRLGLWWRGPLVLLDAIAPGVTARWAMPTPGPTLLRRMRYTLYVQREHPAVGAAWAAASGCSALSCWLIAHHQHDVDTLPMPDASSGEPVRWDEARILLLALQQADNGN